MTVTLQRWPVIGRRTELEVFESALRSDDRLGIVIFGPAGVGKTRFADECLQWAAASGYPTERVVGSRTAALVPLGGVARLLAGGFHHFGPDGQLDTVALFEDAREALNKRHDNNRLVTVVDDVSLLDAASIALLAFLAGMGTIFLIATVPPGEPVPDLVTGMWRDGRVERVDLADLGRTQLDTLLHVALGGPIETGAARELWEITRGNPLYAHELVLGGLHSGALVERSGVWHTEGWSSSTNRLVDLVEARIVGLSPAARSVVDVLALCQPLELDYLEMVTPPGVLEFLERAGLVRIAVADAEVRLAHPLHAEVIRSTLPEMRARTMLLDQAARLGAIDPPPASAPLRIAVWQLDAGERPDPEILIGGAHLARYSHDFRMVRRLIEAIPEDRLDAVGALLLGEALYELGAFEASDRILAVGQGRPSSEPVVLRLGVMRAKNAHWGLCRSDKALAINAETLAQITSGPLIEELVADEASILMFSGRPDRALKVLEGIAGTDGRASVVRAVVLAPALAVTGRTAQAVAVAETGFAAHMALGDELAIAHPATHIVNQVLALTEAGRLAEAEQLARAGAEIVASFRVPIAQIWFAANLGRVATQQGRLATARRHFAEAAGLAEAHLFAGPRRLALSGMVVTLAMLGDDEGAAKALAERDRLPPFGFLGPEQKLADAWAAVVARRPVEARELFRNAAAEAASTGHRIAESWLLHDQMRCGGGDTSARLGQLADECDSPLVSARARHAAALRDHDGHELDAAADDFEALGALLLAAEAASGAALAFRRLGNGRAATAAVRRSGQLASQCEGAATPALVPSDTVAPLSVREREIATLAITGMSSKDISDRLYVSVRTVTNHLQNIYTKLGVTSRAELGQALGATP